MLNKDVPFYWDDQEQLSFEVLKKDLATTPLLSPPNFSRDLVLYLVALDETIGMVLMQEDNSQQKHPIYYLR